MDHSGKMDYVCKYIVIMLRVNHIQLQHKVTQAFDILFFYYWS